MIEELSSEIEECEGKLGHIKGRFLDIKNGLQLNLLHFSELIEESTGVRNNCNTTNGRKLMLKDHLSIVRIKGKMLKFLEMVKIVQKNV